jgi:hypothetical protein
VSEVRGSSARALEVEELLKDVQALLNATPLIARRPAGMDWALHTYTNTHRHRHTHTHTHSHTHISWRAAARECGARSRHGPGLAW